MGLFEQGARRDGEAAVLGAHPHELLQPRVQARAIVAACLRNSSDMLLSFVY